MKKIINSYSELSKLNRRELFKPISEENKELRLISLDKRFAISIARQIADGFENIDLRKEPTAAQYKKARKYITEYYEATRGKNVQLTRPSKKNRKYYAEYSDLSSKFKLYPLITEKAGNSFKIVKRGKSKKLIQSGKFVTYEDYYFPSKKKLAKEPGKEGRKLLNKINRDHKGTKSVRIIVGRYQTHALYEQDFIEEELEKWSQIYGQFEEFTRGLKVATFSNQEKRINVRNKKSNSTKNKKRNAT